MFGLDPQSARIFRRGGSGVIRNGCASPTPSRYRLCGLRECRRAIRQALYDLRPDRFRWRAGRRQQGRPHRRSGAGGRCWRIGAWRGSLRCRQACAITRFSQPWFEKVEGGAPCALLVSYEKLHRAWRSAHELLPAFRAHCSYGSNSFTRTYRSSRRSPYLECGVFVLLYGTKQTGCAVRGFLPGGRCQPALLPGCGVNRPLLKKPHALNHRVT
jgi:hypothetical protein